MMDKFLRGSQDSVKSLTSKVSPEHEIKNITNSFLLKTLRIKHNAFVVMYTYLGFIGYPFSSKYLIAAEGNSDDLDMTRQVSFMSFVLLRALLFSLSMYFLPFFVKDNLDAFPFIVFGCCGLINTYLLVFRRGKVNGIIREMIRLCEYVSPRSYVGKPNVKFEFALALTFLGLQMFLSLIYSFQGAWNYTLGVFEFVFKDAPGLPALTTFAIFVNRLTYIQAVESQLVMLLFCTNFFHTLFTLVDHFCQNLRYEFSTKGYTQITFSHYINTFKEIQQSIRNAEHFFNTILLFVCTATVMDYYNTVYVFMTRPDMYGNTWAFLYVLWNTLINTYVFLHLSMSGEELLSCKSMLADNVLECSEKITQMAPDLNTMEAYSLLVEYVTMAKTTVSGWGLFVIDKGFILYIGGLVLTYVVILYQMQMVSSHQGHHADNNTMFNYTNATFLF